MPRSNVAYVLIPAIIIAAAVYIVVTDSAQMLVSLDWMQDALLYGDAGSVGSAGTGVGLSGIQYRLPLSAPEDIDNWEDIRRFFSDQRTQGLLERNGFAVVDHVYQTPRIAETYKYLQHHKIPIFVTTDSLLHLYHIQFSETLKEIESGYFYADIGELSMKMHQMSLEQHASFSDPVLRKAALENAAFFAVGARLAGAADSFTGLPEQAYQLVDEEIRLTEDASGFSASPLLGYNLDYSQFVPRGHYTQSEELGEYFKAMIWYGNAAFFAKSDAQTVQAVLIADMLLGTPDLQEKWDRIYTVTSFYVGKSDDLGPSDYLSAYRSAGLSGYGELAGEQGMGALKAELAKAASPKIHGVAGLCKTDQAWTPDLGKHCLDDQAGMRFMGQRFTPDSYIFSNLVNQKYEGEGEPFTASLTELGYVRGFPRGLDIMAVMGSERAGAVLEELGDADYMGYNRQREMLRDEFASLGPEDWAQSLYYMWMHSLSSLVKESPAGYPTFMQTDAWEDKDLHTALASWSQLRHDTILYAKQSTTEEVISLPRIPKVAGYVEPALEFYQRLHSLIDQTESGLQGFGVLEEDSAKKISALKSVLSRLMKISEKELENKPLSQDDYKYIHLFGNRILSITIDKGGDKETTLVADVHTDPNTMQVLEEATGHVDLIIVAYKLPDGRIVAGVGPVLSYYEFKQPIGDRLTDEKWRALLDENPPPRPQWVSSFR